MTNKDKPKKRGRPKGSKNKCQASNKGSKKAVLIPIEEITIESYINKSIPELLRSISNEKTLHPNLTDESLEKILITRMEAVCSVLFTRGEAGDLEAVRIIFDRMEGRPLQRIVIQNIDVINDLIQIIVDIPDPASRDYLLKRILEKRDMEIGRGN